MTSDMTSKRLIAQLCLPLQDFLFFFSISFYAVCNECIVECSTLIPTSFLECLKNLRVITTYIAKNKKVGCDIDTTFENNQSKCHKYVHL